MRFAYFVKPHMGGTFTLFSHLRKGLAAHGIEVEWIALEDAGARPGLLPDDDARAGAFVACASTNDGFRAAAMMDALAQRRYDGVFVNVLADRVDMNLARYLPASMTRIMIVHNITPGTYGAARAIREHVHATVGVSERCRRDLVSAYGFDAKRTVAIPNAVDVEAVAMRARPPRSRDDGLRLLYLGRIEDASKGVFWLPDILSKTAEPMTLTVAGDGPDLTKLKARMTRFGDRARFAGSVAQADVPDLLLAHDVMIMPSRFEGFGLTIVEAMAAGCVPVVSHLAGVTDTIVQNGVTGLLFPIGERGIAAACIDELARDPALLDAMSVRSRERARRCFGLEQMADSYAALMRDVVTRKPPVPAALPLSQWAYPSGLRTGLRTYLPQNVKNWLRGARERVQPRSDETRRRA
ncbi:glycosyltransferase family 4 protein [Mesorhizobium sp. CAU 1732]|uniref:glycosyltransferase family 4 protein n=1 Tax=Mesorhizobium sp. CAU 1732 TaxID=3140358 RepID=UPI0032603FEB